MRREARNRYQPTRALGPLAILAQYCAIRGYHMAPLSVVGPVDYSWLIFAAPLGLIAFNETPAPLACLGGALIIIGGILIARTPPPS